MAATDLATRRLDAVVRFRWAMVSAWLLVVAAASPAWASDGDWRYFRTAAGALIGHGASGVVGGTHVYASLPDTQIGPPALLAALPFTWLPAPWDVLVARALMTASMLLVVWLVDRLCEAMGVSAEHRRRGVLLGGLIMAPAWVLLAVDYAHLDDLLVMVLAVVAMLLLVKDRPMWAAAVVGLAVATKPWAIVFAPLLLRSGWRPAVRWTAVAAGVAAAWWLPFLTDPDTVGKLWGFRLPVTLGSGLASLGLDPGVPMPGWVRPAQLLGGALLAVVAVRRGHWTGALLVGLATRVALDPNPMLYYGIGPVLGALIWDLTRTKAGVPWTTGLATAAFSLAPAFSDRHVVGGVTLVTCAGLILSVLLRRSARPVPARAVPADAQALV